MRAKSAIITVPDKTRHLRQKGAARILTPVIIDTDPGIDDAFAIMLAAASDRLDIVGLTSVDGNVKEEYTARNALDLAGFLGISCPVARGDGSQLEVPVPNHGEHIHGESGMGGVTLPRSQADFDKRPAWDFIYDTAKEHAGSLVLLAIGPLTNVARAIIAHADLIKYVKQIVIMGGSTEGGNRTPYAEFNFWADPPAAKVVFGSGIPIAMAGLNVTLKTGVPIALLDELSERPSRLKGMLTQMARDYSDRVVGNDNAHVSIVHDAIAVFYAAHPEWCETKKCKITIDADVKSEQWGRSLADFSDPASFNTTLITDVDMQKYLAEYESMVEYFA